MASWPAGKVWQCFWAEVQSLGKSTLTNFFVDCVDSLKQQLSCGRDTGQEASSRNICISHSFGLEYQHALDLNCSCWSRAWYPVL